MQLSQTVQPNFRYLRVTSHGQGAVSQSVCCGFHCPASSPRRQKTGGQGWGWPLEILGSISSGPVWMTVSEGSGDPSNTLSCPSPPAGGPAAVVRTPPAGGQTRAMNSSTPFSCVFFKSLIKVAKCQCEAVLLKSSCHARCFFSRDFKLSPRLPCAAARWRSASCCSTASTRTTNASRTSWWRERRSTIPTRASARARSLPRVRRTLTRPWRPKDRHLIPQTISRTALG